MAAAKRLPVATQQALCRRLQRAPKGPWRTLLVALVEALKPSLAYARGESPIPDQGEAEA